MYRKPLTKSFICGTIIVSKDETFPLRIHSKRHYVLGLHSDYGNSIEQFGYVHTMMSVYRKSGANPLVSIADFYNKNTLYFPDLNNPKISTNLM